MPVLSAAEGHARQPRARNRTPRKTMNARPLNKPPPLCRVGYTATASLFPEAGMAIVESAQIRNVVLLSHGGAGKTSLAEALVFAAGATSRQGRVEDGNTVSDFNPDEQQRGMSVSLAVLSFDYESTRVNLIDTPGYADFLGEMIAGASAADVALILVDAASGVQVGTETAWDLADRRSMPRVVVVSRLDRENANWERTLESVQAAYGARCQPIFLPIGVESSLEGVVGVISGRVYRGAGEAADDAPAEMADAIAAAREAVVERIAEADDDLTLKYLEGEALTDEELSQGLNTAILRGTLVPVVPTAATTNVGTRALLGMIAAHLPTPLALGPLTARADGEDAALEIDPTGPPAALIFKTTADEFVGRLTYFRLLTGAMRGDAHLWNAQRGESERISNLSHVFGKELRPAEGLAAGDIGAVTKLSVSGTFDTLCDKSRPLIVPPPTLPAPAYAAAIRPKTKADVDRLGASLQRLIEEDPTLHIERDPDTHDTIISGLGESHVGLAAEKLRRKFKVDVDVADRRIPYRETITAVGRAEYLHKKQTGGHGQYARVALRLEPRGRGDGFEFDSEISGASVPRNYIPAVEKGVEEALPGGVVAHYPLTDLKVVLYDGKHHDVDSSEMAFKLAASQALKEAVLKARPILLEPILSLRITAPESATGDVMSDLNGRRARVLGVEPGEHARTTIAAEGPMAEFLHYATDLRSMTGGRGAFASEFVRYDPVPEHVAQRVVANAKAQAEAAT